jgi:nitroimidazol reductase NimA-like FMN-containing flavoprotein (pyridoxamine 5'-phosphate oxidase superfamily)
MDRVISEDAAKGILQHGEYGVLSTVSPEGQPYGVPLSYSYADGVIYFHCAPDGHKVDNFGRNARISFCVVGKTEIMAEKFETQYESAIVFGEVKELTGTAKYRGLLELVKKYSGEYLEAGQQFIEKVGGKTRVYQIEIESITGKARKK